jgi:hypothetical protein
VQDGTVIPIGDLGLRTGLTNAVDSSQQEIVSWRGAGAGLRPERLQKRKNASLLGGEPKRTGQPEVTHGGGQRHGGGAVLDQVGDLFGGAQIGLVDDAGFAIDASAFDDVVVELIALFLGDEGGHIG